MSSVYVSFDFNAGFATLSGLTDEPIQNTIRLEDTQLLPNTKMCYIEYELDQGAKWVFVWEQYADYEQYCRIQQYLPSLVSRPPPLNYDPWTTIASWSYLTNSQISTNQQSRVYRNIYHPEQFPEMKDITFMIKGTPGGDWDTTEYTNGYWH